MRLSIESIFSIILFFLCFLSLSICRADAETLSFETVMQQAKEASFDLRIAEIDSKLARNSWLTAKADLLPTSQAIYNTEYVQGLSNQQAQNQSVAVVGSTVLPGSTRWQQLFGISNNWSLDFGARLSQVSAAKARVRGSIAGQHSLQRDLQLQVLEKYERCLIAYSALKSRYEILPTRQRLFEISERLSKAKKIWGDELSESAVGLARTMSEISQLKQSLADNLNDLSSLTKHNYNPDTIILTAFRPSLVQAVAFDFKSTPDYKTFKEQESELASSIKALELQCLPAITLYTGVYFYGNDASSLSRSIQDISPRQVTYGISMQLPLFDAGKNKLARLEKKLELQKIAVQKEKRKSEMENEFHRATQNVSLYTAELRTQATLIKSTSEKIGIVSALNLSKFREETKVIQERIALIEREAEQEQMSIKRQANLYRMQIMADAV